ncbi:tyrosine-type recombinase/integrase [Thalassolituus sp.]|uniref:tyrosine-type recombinase/integrase n=1 Tax=Thalassolituus sp. TaxID=2030822 RepID=UPI0035198674
MQKNKLSLVKPSFESSSDVLFEKDKWELTALGYSDQAISSSSRSLNFEQIKNSWLKASGKKLLWNKRHNCSANTLVAYLRVLRAIDRVAYHEGEGDEQGLSMNVIRAYVDSLSNLSNSTKFVSTSTLNEMLASWAEYGTPAEVERLPSHLRVRQERKISVKALSPYVQSKLESLCTPADTYLKRYILIAMEIGPRGNELLHLKRDCLARHSDGWTLARNNSKNGKFQVIPISDKAASLVSAQIAESKTLAGQCNENSDYIFIHKYEGQAKVYSLRNINIQLSRFCAKSEITDELGKPVHLSTHMFRHTVGTNLINNGVTEYYVQKFLGHSTPMMTNHYAHINDKSMRKALSKANGSMCDIKGKIYDLQELAKQSEWIDANHDSELSLDAKWLRKKLSAHALPNGICSLPIHQECSHANACLTCASFRTSQEHLPALTTQRDRADKLKTEATSKGLTRQAELNRKTVENLNIIIRTLSGGCGHA